MKAELKQRWNTDVGKQFVEHLLRAGRSGNGCVIQESPFGILPGLQRLDLRGMLLPRQTELRRVSIKNADLTGAEAIGVWVEHCEFTDVWFDGASFNQLSDHGNTFVMCKFNTTKLKESAFGFLGSNFARCEFVGVDFRRAIFIRPEFDGCLFDACVFNGVDFNGASFENCEFRGKLSEVWFRGGFPLASDSDKYGNPRSNKMIGVNFDKAQLFDVSFSDHCDLSSVVPPSDGRHMLLDRWQQRLELLLQSSRNLSRPFQIAIESFCKPHLVHAQKQDWYLLGLDDLVEEFDVEIGTQIWNGLRKN